MPNNRKSLLTILLTFSLLPISIPQVYSQSSIVYQYDFEAGYDGWSVDNGVWQIGPPTVGPQGCHGGSNCATTGLNGNYPNNTSSRLISPSIALPSIAGAEEIHLRFWQWFSWAVAGNGEDDRGQVQIQTYDSTTGLWSAWQDEGEPSRRLSPVWSLKDIDLTSYAGKTIRIAFFHIDTNPYHNAVSLGWYVDDIEIVKKIPQFTGVFESGWGDWGADNGIWQIGTLTVGPEGCRSGSNCAVTVLTGNYPNNTSSRLISPSIELPSIAGAEEIHLRFWQWFSWAVAGNGEDDRGQVQISTYDAATAAWSAWENVGDPSRGLSPVWSLKDIDLTRYAGKRIRIAFFHIDTNPYHNAVSLGWYVDDIEIVKKIPQFTGCFENGWGDWSADNGIWQIGTPTVGPQGCHGGSNCATTGLNANYPNNTSSSLISPSIELPSIPGAEGIHLRFWQWFNWAVAGNGEDDRGQVRIKTYNAATGAWSDWQDEGPPSRQVSSSWSPKDIDLTSYAGKRIRIGFFHIDTNPYHNAVSLGWYIDDVEITGVAQVCPPCDQAGQVGYLFVTYLSATSAYAYVYIAPTPTPSTLTLPTSYNYYYTNNPEILKAVLVAAAKKLRVSINGNATSCPTTGSYRYGGIIRQIHLYTR